MQKELGQYLLPVSRKKYNTVRHLKKYPPIFWSPKFRRTRVLTFCDFANFFTMNSLSVSWIQFEFTIFFANKLCIHYLFREFTVNFLCDSQIHYESINCFANSQWVQFLRINFEFTIYYANSLWFHSLTREFAMNRYLFWNSLFVFEFPTCFTNSLWIHIPFRE